MFDDLANKAPVFQLKASLYTLTTLHLLGADLSVLNEQLNKLCQQSPKFLSNSPIIIDFQRLSIHSTEPDFNFAQLKSILKNHQLIIVGLRHVPLQWQEFARQAGFALLPDAANQKPMGAHSTELTAKNNANPGPNRSSVSQQKRNDNVSVGAPASAESSGTMLVNRTIRSGQQIYAKNADLIVIGSISPGAEIIADGNIHIYGHLKGRALAGANGNTEARIFCQHLGAELVAIAGHYWLNEILMNHISPSHGPVQIYLENEQLKVSNF